MTTHEPRHQSKAMRKTAARLNARLAAYDSAQSHRSKLDIFHALGENCMHKPGSGKKS